MRFLQNSFVEDCRCSYYLVARKKNRDLINNLIPLNVRDKSFIAHKKFTTCSTIYRYVRYGYRVVLDTVSFWDAKNSKGRIWGSFSCEICICDQKMFGTTCIWKMSKDNRKFLKILTSTCIVMCTNFLIISHILQSYASKWAISVFEMHCSI